MSEIGEEGGNYPSASYYKTSKYRLTPVLITIIVLIIMIALVYIFLVIIDTRPSPCSTAPTQPQDVIAGYIDNRNFGVQWSKVLGADSYLVKIGEIRNFTGDEAIVQLETAGTRATIFGLDTGRAYYIKVASKNSCGTSIDSIGITYVFIET